MMNTGIDKAGGIELTDDFPTPVWPTTLVRQSTGKHDINVEVTYTISRSMGKRMAIFTWGECAEPTGWNGVCPLGDAAVYVTWTHVLHEDKRFKSVITFHPFLAA